jgi:arylsulfatase A-like enzyme
VTLAPERATERRAEEARPAGHEDAHRILARERVNLTSRRPLPIKVRVKRSVAVAGAGGAVALALAAALLFPARQRRPRVPLFTPPPRSTARVRNVVLVTIDTLRADHLSLYGYPRRTTPHIDAFAAASTTYDNAYATATFTSPSILSLLTGLYPPSHGVRFLRQPRPPQVWTLPGHLRGLGWHTAAVVSNWVLKGSASGLAGEFDVYDDQMTEPEPNRPEVLERNAERTTDAALRWLDARDPGPPFLLWVHYIDPHGPYVPPPPFDGQFVGPAGKRVRREKIPWYQRLGKVETLGRYVDRYDGEIAYVDEHVGRLLLGLERRALLGDTLVVLTSDHGESLVDRHRGPARYFRHGQHVWEELARVPLVVYRPGGTAGRSRALVSLVDVVPTVLRALDVPAPDARFDGAPLAEGHGAPVFVEASDKTLRAVRWGRFKLIARVPTAESKAVAAASVFDLATDPLERHPRPATAPEQARLLVSLGTYLAADRQDLDALRAEVRAATLAASPDGGDVRRLRALGYVQ